MEQRSRRVFLGRFFALIAGCALTAAAMLAPRPVLAAEQCTTVKDCAASMVLLANALKKDNEKLLARIQALEAALAQQKVDTVVALEKRLDAMKAGTVTETFGGNRKTSECPAGSVMVGARFQIDDGNSHGVVSNLGPTCRSMP